MREGRADTNYHPGHGRFSTGGIWILSGGVLRPGAQDRTDAVLPCGSAVPRSLGPVLAAIEQQRYQRTYARIWIAISGGLGAAAILSYAAKQLMGD